MGYNRSSGWVTGETVLLFDNKKYRWRQTVAEKSSGKQEMEADVIVVGYGAAGAAAAITAHDNGARVLILEKMPEGGGNSRVCGGSIFYPTGMEAVQHVEALCGRVTDREIIETYVENAMKNKGWIEQLGGETVPPPYIDICYPPIPPGTRAWWPNVVASEFVNGFEVKGESKRPAERLWKVLSTNVEQRGIPVMTGTPARELTTNENGEVVGVIAERVGEKISVKAKRAVVLTCGGFEYNEAMKEAFLLCHPFHAFGNPGNTGDGIRMAQKVGAALWHMTIVEGYLGFKPPEYETAFSVRMLGEGFIYVDTSGKRFTNETGLEMHDTWRAVSPFNSGALGYPRIPAYAIFDEVLRRKGPFHQGTSGYNRDYEWSLDNSKEVAKGWIKRGKTVRELAGQIQVDESTLENTVLKYNEYCKLGSDPDCGRSRETLVPIERSPYYAIQLWPCLLNTQGGPRRDREARILGHEGRPIPRLYSAGEFGSLWGLLYEGGGNIAECLAFGRIAGRNAATEKPRG